MTQCENYDQISIRDMCKLFNMDDQLWTDFVKHATPKPKCPLNTSINIENATVELGFVSYLPFDGYTWTFSFKAFKEIGTRLTH